MPRVSPAAKMYLSGGDRRNVVSGIVLNPSRDSASRSSGRKRTGTPLATGFVSAAQPDKTTNSNTASDVLRANRLAPDLMLCDQVWVICTDIGLYFVLLCVYEPESRMK